MDALIKAKDVARILNLRISTVYELVRRRELPHVIVSKGKRRSLIRFRQSEIETFIDRRSVSAVGSTVAETGSMAPRE